MKKLSLRLYITFVFIIIAILATWGYNYGRGDQAEIIPYALYLSGQWHSDLPLFVQNILSYFPNERFAVAHLLAVFGKILPLAVFLLHFFTTYFLVIGIYKIAEIYVKDYLALCVVLLMMLPLWGINFGGNELYYNNFQASTISKTIAIWGLYFYLQNQTSKAFYFFSVSTIFHLLAGLQIGFLILAAYFFSNFYFNKKFPKIYFSQIIFVLIAIFYAVGMKISLDNDIKPITEEQYFQAMFQWKFNEHYAVLDFQKVGLILYITSLIAIFYFFKNHVFFIILLFLHILGAIIYLLGFYMISSNFIVSLQWFKTTIWIKLLGMISIMGISQKIYSKIQKNQRILGLSTLILVLGLLLLFFKFNRIFLFIAILGCILLIIQRKISDNFTLGILSFITFCGIWNHKDRIPLDFFFIQDDKIEFCKEIQKIKEKMLVIVPINFTELESYSGKPSYINFIATPKKNAYFAKYLKRIEEVYGLKPKNYPIKKELDFAKEFYHNKNWNEWQKFKNQGVTHIITEDKKFSEIQPVIKKGKWYLWKL